MTPMKKVVVSGGKRSLIYCRIESPCQQIPLSREHMMRTSNVKQKLLLQIVVLRFLFYSFFPFSPDMEDRGPFQSFLFLNYILFHHLFCFSLFSNTIKHCMCVMLYYTFQKFITVLLCYNFFFTE